MAVTAPLNFTNVASHSGPSLDSALVQCIESTVDPAITDDSSSFFFVGYLWHNSSTGSWFKLEDNTAGGARWELLSNITKNDIINGQFRVAQAGTSFAAPASGDYDLDGWLQTNTSAAVFTVVQIVGSGTGKLGRSVTVTTADATVAAGDYVAQTTRIEGYDIVKYIGNTFTIGFRVKCNITGIHCMTLYTAGYSYVSEYTINAANTWEYKTITIVGGIGVTPPVTNAAGLTIQFTNMCGTSFQTTAGAWNVGNFKGTANQVNDFATISSVFALEDVTMNLGTSVAPDAATYEQDLSRCKRYYKHSYSSGVAVGAVTIVGSHQSGGADNSAAVARGTVNFESMRAIPTLVIYDCAGNAGKISTLNSAGSQTDNQTYSAVSVSDKSVSVQIYNKAGAYVMMYHYTLSSRL